MSRIRQLYQYRHFFWSLVTKEFKVRYTQSFLGLSWMVLEPLLLVVTLTTIFTLIDRKGPEGVPFAVFFYSGLLAWNLFSRSFTGGTNAFLSDKGLMQKIPFPREISILKNYSIQFVEFLFANIAFVAVLVWYQVAPNWNWLYLPALLILQLIFILGLTFLTGSLNVYLRDVGVLSKTLASIWFWFSGVIFYFPPEGQTKILYYVNPLTGIISGFRDVILFDRPPVLEHLYSIMIANVIFLTLGYYVFRKLERNFIDVI
jgi:lipopolysaccharide transport system permease protein